MPDSCGRDVGIRQRSIVAIIGQVADMRNSTMELRKMKERDARPLFGLRSARWGLAVAAAALCVTVAWASPSVEPEPATGSAGAASGAEPAAQGQRAEAEAELEAIRKLIEQKMAQAQSSGEEKAQPANTPPRPAALQPARAPKQTAQPEARSLQSEAEAAADDGKQSPAAHKGGCGAPDGSEVDLTPPGPNEPQPKWECATPEVVLEPMWSGEDAVFAFKVRNAGEGPLNIRVRAG
jgi:hypothetical protein